MNWVTADIKKDIEGIKNKIERYKSEGRKDLVSYNRGVLKGLELALKNIEKAFGN